MGGSGEYSGVEHSIPGCKMKTMKQMMLGSFAGNVSPDSAAAPAAGIPSPAGCNILLSGNFDVKCIPPSC